MSMVAWILASAPALALACMVLLNHPHRPNAWDIRAEFPHRAPATQPSVEEAMSVAHEHRRCHPQDCSRRRAALRVLYEARRIDLSESMYVQLFERPE